LSTVDAVTLTLTKNIKSGRPVGNLKGSLSNMNLPTQAVEKTLDEDESPRCGLGDFTSYTRGDWKRPKVARFEINTNAMQSAIMRNESHDTC
jgi:hypothetical protein